MNIDWSKAPEDATHKDPDTDCFYKLVKDVWHLIFGDGESVVSASIYNGETKPSDLIERPKKQEAWGGEGLPPVGVTCEFTSNDGYNWKPCRILYTDEVSILTGELEGKADRRLLRKCDADVKFRPIPTAEQVAAEKRDKAVSEMVDSLKRFNSIHEACGMLYDAGYLKP